MVVNKITSMLFGASLTILSAESTAAEFFVNMGFSHLATETLISTVEAETLSESSSGYQFGGGIRTAQGSQNQHIFGFGIDVTRVLGDSMVGVRALDYQYQINSQWRVGGFFGAATLDSGLPQNGYYGGINTSWLEQVLGADIMLEIRRGDGLARDRLLASDPPGYRPDIFLDFTGASLMLNWRW